MTALPTNWGIGAIPGMGQPMVGPPAPMNWMQRAQQGMQNPMFGMGIGLLSGALQGDPGRGMNIGLQNMLQMQRANEATTMLGMRIEEMRRQRAEQDEQRRAMQKLYTDPQALTAAQAGQLDVANQLQFPTPEKAQSAIGKLQSDLEAGRISPEQYGLGVQQILKPETVVNMGQKQIPIPQLGNLVGPEGQPPPLGTTYEQAAQAGYRYQSPTEQKEARQSTEVVGRAQDAYDKYTEMLNKHGPTIVPGKDKMELSSAYTNLKLEMKELFELGALSGPDMDLMEELLTDPTSLASQILEASDFQPQLDVVGEKLKAARQRANEMYGDNPTIVDWNDLPD